MRTSLILDLESAIQSGSPERRTNTLRRITDLFVLGAPSFGRDHIEIFDEVIGRLADRIEASARAELAARLAPIPNAPLRVIRALADDDVIDVAGPVLSGSARLSDDDLVRAATQKGQEHLLAISQRQRLSEAVTDVLVQRGDTQVVRSVVDNDGARFSDRGFGILVQRSVDDDVLAERMGRRRDLPRRHFEALLRSASQAAKKRIAATNPGRAAEVEEAVAAVAKRLAAENQPPARDYSEAKRTVSALAAARKLDGSAIEAFARDKKLEELIASLSMMTRLPLEQVEKCLLDDGMDADLSLILARAADISWSTTKLLMLLRAQGRGLSPQDLEDAKVRFEKLQVATAQRVIRFHLVRDGVAKPA
jgi:uncharacterized protein (DUF2336 family)